MNYYLNENLVRMFFGIYMITVADPQILWNDGFYPLVDVTIPDGSYWKPKLPGRAQRAATTASGGSSTCSAGCSARTTRRCSTRPGFSSSPHFMYSGNYTSGDRKGEWFQLYSIGFGGIPGRPIGDGPDGHSLWPSFVNIPCEYLESYYPLRIERWETVADTGGAGLHRGGNGVDVAYRFLEPGTIAIHDDRWLTYPWGVNGGEPGARGRKWIERADGTTRGAAQQVPRRPGRPGRRAALRHLGRRRLGRPAGARPRWSPWRCGAGWSPRTAPAATAWWWAGRRHGPGGDRGAAGGDARRTARPSCRSSTWGRRWPRSSNAAWRRPGCPRPPGRWRYERARA